MSGQESNNPNRRNLIVSVVIGATLTAAYVHDRFVANDDPVATQESGIDESTERVELNSSKKVSESKNYNTPSARDFDARSIGCKPIIELPNLDMIIPISWIGAYANGDRYRTDPYRFPANLVGKAVILQCLGDTSTIQYSSRMSREADETTFVVGGGGVQYVFDSTNLEASVSLANTSDLKSMLQAENPKATKKDAIWLEDLINANRHNVCQLTDYYLDKEVRQAKDDIFTMGEDSIVTELEKQAERQNIDTSTISFVVKPGTMHPPTICNSSNKKPAKHPNRFRVLEDGISVKEGTLQLIIEKEES